MTVVFNQTGSSFTAGVTGTIDGQTFTNPQASACLVTNTGGNAASVQFSVNDTDPQYAQWPAEGVPGFGTIVQPGDQQVLVTNATAVENGVSAYATYVCDAGKTTTLVFNLGAV